MRYKLLHTTFKRSIRTAVILDFQANEILEIPLSKEVLAELPEELRKYLDSKWDKLMNGHWDYTP
ncbi:hypothetical protein LC040_02715 [Bacillus tianshenii]|nr:hypothetical protein LC040_02715 [Bacillus tianshenii]